MVGLRGVPAPGPPRGRRSPHRPPAYGGGPALAMRPSRPRRSSLEAGRGRGGGAPPPAGFWWRAKMGGEGIEGPATMQRSSAQIELTEGPRRRGGPGPRPAHRPRADDLRSPPRPLRRRSEHLKRLVNTHVTPGKQYRCKVPCLRPSGLRGSAPVLQVTCVFTRSDYLSTLFRSSKPGENGEADFGGRQCSRRAGRRPRRPPRPLPAPARRGLRRVTSAGARRPPGSAAPRPPPPRPPPPPPPPRRPAGSTGREGRGTP